MFMFLARGYGIVLFSSAVGLTNFLSRSGLFFLIAFPCVLQAWRKNVLEMGMGEGGEGTQITFILRRLLILFL